MSKKHQPGCPCCHDCEFFRSDASGDLSGFEESAGFTFSDGAYRTTTDGSKLLILAPNPDGVPTSKLAASIMAPAGAIVRLALAYKSGTYFAMEIKFGDADNGYIAAVDESGTRLDAVPDPATFSVSGPGAFFTCIKAFQDAYAILAGTDAIVEPDDDAAQLAIIVVTAGGGEVAASSIVATKVGPTCSSCGSCPNCAECCLCGGKWVGADTVEEYQADHPGSYPGQATACSIPTGLELNVKISIQSYAPDDVTTDTPLTNNTIELGNFPLSYDPESCAMTVEDSIEGAALGTITIPLGTETEGNPPEIEKDEVNIKVGEFIAAACSFFRTDLIGLTHRVMGSGDTTLVLGDSDFQWDDGTTGVNGGATAERSFPGLEITTLSDVVDQAGLKEHACGAILPDGPVEFAVNTPPIAPEIREAGTIYNALRARIEWDMTLTIRQS